MAQVGGDAWFPTTVFGGGSLVRVDRSGSTQAYVGVHATSIAYDSQGRAYVTDPDKDEISILVPAGKVGSIAWPDAQSIRACPDGSFWVLSVTSTNARIYSRIDATGVVLAGPVTVTAAILTDVVDASGALWITSIFDTTNLVRIAPDGTMSAVTVPFATAGFASLGLTATGDGLLIFANGTTTIRMFDLSLQPVASFTAPAPIHLVTPGRARTIVAFSQATRQVFALGRTGTVLRSFVVPWAPTAALNISNVWESPDGSFWVDGSKGVFQFAAERFDVHGVSMGSFAGLGAGPPQGDVTGRMLLEFAASSADLDNDGATNRVELVVGSNPLDAASVPAALTATSSGTSSGGSIAIQIHAPASANQPYFVALSLNGRGGVKLDPPYATPSVPLGQDPLLTLSLRAPPMRPTLGGVLDANGDASSVTSFGPVLSGRTVYVSAIYATPSDVPAATAQVAVTMP